MSGRSSPASSSARRPSRVAVRRSAASVVPERIEPRLLFSSGGTSVYTYHNDANRTGADLTETQLTPTTVAAGSFGLQHTLAVDGQIYAQPLYVHGVSVNGTPRDVVYVATEHDSVYAFDADTGAQLWRREYTNPAAGITTPTSDDVGVDDISPEIGITGTPVIDHATGTMYFVTVLKTTVNGTATFSQQLRAVNIATGADQFGGSTTIQESLSGAGEGYTGTDNSMVPFDPLTENQRPGLLLSNGEVYVGFASHGDNDPYHGWLFAFNTRTLGIDAAIDLSPDGLRAPLWMGGGAPSVDAAGNIYVSTGNGTYDAPLGGYDYGDSVLKITRVKGYTAEGASGLKVADYFTPYNEAQLNLNDKDLGSGGVLLVPGTHEAITGGKDANLYVMNTQNLGGFSLSGNHIVQDDATATGGDQIRATPAYFNGAIYLAGLGGPLVGYKLTGGQIAATPIGTSAEVYANPGATPSVSANGTKNGIVWAIQRVVPTGGDAGSGVPTGYTALNAYNAATMKLLYSSATDPAGGGTSTPAGIKFAVPTVADGHVFVGTANGLLEYGLTPRVTAVQVLNAATHAVLFTLANGGTISLSSVKGSLALSATLNLSTARSVRYTFASGGSPVVQNTAPFHLFDNAATHAGVFAAGKHTITADPFDGAGATGFEGTGLTFTYTVD